MRRIQVVRSYALALLRNNVPDLIATTLKRYNRKLEKDFRWLEYDENYQGAFCEVCRKLEGQSTSQGSSGVLVTKPFQNSKKVIQKVKAHA